MRLVTGGHHTADVVGVGPARLARCLVVPRDASSDAEVALDIDLRLVSDGRCIIPTKLSPSVQTRRMLHNLATLTSRLLPLGATRLVQSTHLLSRRPCGRRLVGIIVNDRSLVREGLVKVFLGVCRRAWLLLLMQGNIWIRLSFSWACLEQIVGLRHVLEGSVEAASFSLPKAIAGACAM